MPSTRSAHLDNCKGLLILAVVWYHSLVVYYSPNLPLGVAGLESILLLLVMPGFSLLSGYLSSPHLNSKRQDNLFSMFAAFVVFQLLNWLMNILNTAGLNAYISKTNSSGTNGSTTTNTTSIPYPIPIFFPTVMSHIPDTKALPVTWFLLALLFWRALTPIVVRFRSPVATAFVVGLLGLCTDLGFGSQNIIAFLPWYVLGVYFRYSDSGQRQWQQYVLLSPPVGAELLNVHAESSSPSSSSSTSSWSWQRMQPTLVSLALLFVPLMGCSIISAVAPLEFSTTVGSLISHGYSCLYGLPPSATAQQCTSFYAWGTRSLFYVLSLPIIAGFVRIVPQQNIPLITKSGINSVAIYLFHPLLLFNIVTLVLVSKSLDWMTHGTGAVAHNGAPPFQGGFSFVFISLLGVVVFLVLSLDCWRGCCWICLRPPIVRMLIVDVDTCTADVGGRSAFSDSDRGSSVRRRGSKRTLDDFDDEIPRSGQLNEPLL